MNIPRPKIHSDENEKHRRFRERRAKRIDELTRIDTEANLLVVAALEAGILPDRPLKKPDALAAIRIYLNKVSDAPLRQEVNAKR